MDRGEFAWLLLHANALPMLAMRQLMGEIERDLAQAPPPHDDGLTEAQREEQSRLAMEDLADRIEADPELAALTNFDFFPPPLSEGEMVSLEQQLHHEDAVAKQADLADVPDGPLDLARFLSRAYANPLAVARIDAAFARADIPALLASMALLPADLPRLTAPMDASGMQRWLAFFLTQDRNFEDLVFNVTGLDEGD